MHLQAGKRSDWKDGTMKEIPIDSQDEKSPKVLVSQVKGILYATSSKCTHYGAPLIKGILTPEGCLTCPWHGAKFSVCKEGDIEDAPGLNGLQSFKVIIDGDHVLVDVDVELVKKTEFGRTPDKCLKASTKLGPGVVVIGGGAAGQHFVEEIRRLKFTGKVTLISEEPHLPIDRTKLSKALITDPSKIAWRDENFYKDSDIEIKINTTVEKIDLGKQSVSLSDGTSLPYEKLVVATGASARRLPLDGSTLQGISTLRSIADTQTIDKLLSGPSGATSGTRSIALIGSSFICMELAIFVAKKENLNVHVIGMDKVPLGNILGEEIGAGLKKFHEKNGVTFHLEAGLDKFLPSDSDPSHVGAVALKSGEVIKCDGVVLGVGAKPNTDLLSAAGIALEKDGSVVVDEYLRIKDSKAKGQVYAVGDIAKFPDLLTDGSLTRIEHWNVAGNHARTAAQNIQLSESSSALIAFTKPAIFWSAQGQQLRYVGTGKASQWKDVFIDGSADEMKFVAYYYIGEEVVAVATMQRDPVMVQAAELFRLKKFPSVSEVRNGVNLLTIKL